VQCSHRHGSQRLYGASRTRPRFPSYARTAPGSPRRHESLRGAHRQRDRCSPPTTLGARAFTARNCCETRGSVTGQWRLESRDAERAVLALVAFGIAAPRPAGRPASRCSDRPLRERARPCRARAAGHVVLARDRTRRSTARSSRSSPPSSTRTYPRPAGSRGSSAQSTLGPPVELTRGVIVTGTHLTPSLQEGVSVRTRCPVSPESLYPPGIPAKRMERLWSLAVATSGNWWQLGRPRKRLEQAKTVATRCDRLPFGAHGKEGVDGSSPSEGSAKAP
jgi:hypothetical protein